MINTDLINLKLNKNYKIAYSILFNILENKCPALELLESLYGHQKASKITEMLKTYFAGKPAVNLKPRQNNYNGPRDIILARSKLEQTENYQNVHKALLLNKYPEITDLRVFYGDYADFVIEIFGMYIELNLKRKCDISAATHLNRVGSMVYQAILARLKPEMRESLKTDSGNAASCPCGTDARNQLPGFLRSMVDWLPSKSSI